MKRKFYYHPDNSKEAMTAMLEGRLVAPDLSHFVECAYIPKEDGSGNPILGFWVDEFEPADFFRPLPEIPSALFEYPKLLTAMAQIIAGTTPHGI